MYSKKEQSLIDRILIASLKLARMKERNTFKTFTEMNDTCRPHRLMDNLFSISSGTVRERKVWTIAPLEDRHAVHILFLHGGAYVTNMTPAHWFFIGTLVQKLNVAVIVPDYPLAPAHTVEDVFDMLLPVYRELTGRVGASQVIVMGDSAGGGMALALCQLIHEKGLQQAGGLYLLSPWLDVHMDNPAIPDMDEKDPVLNVQGLIDSGKAYAGALDRSSYLVSPLYGSLDGLPPVHVYAGTREILLPDVRAFKAKAEQAGVSLSYHEVEGLIHDGMLFPTPEGKSCREAIVAALAEKIKK